MQPNSIGMSNIIAGNQALRREYEALQELYMNLSNKLATALEDFRKLQAENYDQAIKLVAANEVIKVMEDALVKILGIDVLQRLAPYADTESIAEKALERAKKMREGK